MVSKAERAEALMVRICTLVLPCSGALAATGATRSRDLLVDCLKACQAHQLRSVQSLTRSGCCVSPQGWGEAYDRTAALWEERTGTPYKLHWSEIRSTYNRAIALSRGRQH